MKRVFEHPDFQIKRIIMTHFHPLDVVGRSSETQLQMGENLNR